MDAVYRRRYALRSQQRPQGFLPIANGDPDKELAGICPGATFHSLRHAAATILLEQGVHMPVVSDLLGPSTTRVTPDVCSHVTARLVAEAGAALCSWGLRSPSPGGC